VYTRVLDVIGTSVTSVLSMPLVPVSFLGLNLMWIFLALGVSIGAWGSIVSMRRFLDT
jgi:cell division transport system permease protein